MKTLKLIKLHNHDNLNKGDMSRIKGGECRSWLCCCYPGTQVAQEIDDELERRDRMGEL